ncbi:macrolide export protein MacA [Geobacter sp. OR-1]|uniref:efflux RND transporter periplasmic adaptor subunit n=1 Tax=Geobacter sp. OR-1 TaxID=1266765 RepID=UPI00054422D5|nr:efflux RND transporter periplasmic adaptor subunit [Geobacter sp. OR-1]GAM07998.1 macrolide export protein MacA [Geobacter sp. OR-1]
MSESDLSSLKIDKKTAGYRPPRLRKRLTLCGIVLAVIVLLVAAWRMFSVTTVETVTVSQIYPSQSFTILNASGYVVAQRKAAVAPKTTGQIEWLGVEEGSRVKGGQLLARLENRDVTANRDSAAASLDTARANLDQANAELIDADRAFTRARQLVDAGVLSRADFDTAEARLSRAKAASKALAFSIKSAQAGLAAADAALEYTMIRAPFDAVVLTKNADVGDIVTPIGAAANAKAAVVTIADLASIQVEADVSESNLAKIKVGQPCEILLDALPDARFRGVLYTIVPTADRSKASVLVKVRFIDIAPGILPEMSAKVAFLEREVKPGEQSPKTAVPQEAMVKRGGRSSLFVLKGDRVREVSVTAGEKIGDLVTVLSGVKAGEVIVSRPPENLGNGAKVKLAEKK